MVYTILFHNKVDDTWSTQPSTGLSAPPVAEPMQIFVKTETGRVLVVDAASDWYVHRLHSALALRLQIPLIDFYLSFAGRVLRYMDTFERYRVRDGSTVFLHLTVDRCLGGGKRGLSSPGSPAQKQPKLDDDDGFPSVGEGESPMDDLPAFDEPPTFDEEGTWQPPVDDADIAADHADAAALELEFASFMSPDDSDDEG